jgi:DNA topoisomerase IA
MENKCIETPASGDSLIETLIDRQCIERKGPFLRPADKGLVIYNSTKDMRISDIETASEWERMLKNVGRGKHSSKTFLKAMEIFTRQAIEEILSLNPAKMLNSIN